MGESAQQSSRHTAWDFGDFKPTREEIRAGQTITVFNALVDEGDAVTLQSFDTRDDGASRASPGFARACSCWR